jgi:hypothetical protein
MSLDKTNTQFPPETFDGNENAVLLSDSWGRNRLTLQQKLCNCPDTGRLLVWPEYGLDAEAVFHSHTLLEKGKRPI